MPHHKLQIGNMHRVLDVLTDFGCSHFSHLLLLPCPLQMLLVDHSSGQDCGSSAKHMHHQLHLGSSVRKHAHFTCINQ